MNIEYINWDIILEICDYLEDEYIGNFILSFNRTMRNNFYNDFLDRKIKLKSYYCFKKENFNINSYAKIEKITTFYNDFLDIFSDFNKRNNITHLEMLNGPFININEKLQEYLPNLKNIMISYPTNNKIKLPDIIKKVTLEFVFDMEKIDFPENLEQLNIKNTFHDSISKISHLTKLKYLIFGDITKKINYSYFNNNIDGVLPESIEYLVLGGVFDNDINKLPKNLTHLYLSDTFNKNIDNLPKKLKCLMIGNSFDKNIDILPDNLEYLIIGNSFNQHINNLPKNLKILIIGKSFNKNINHIPNNLRNLIIPINCKINIPNIDMDKTDNIYDNHLYKKIKNMFINII